MRITDHANRRSQQRGIPPIVLDLLARFGREKRSGSGIVRYTMDKATRRRLRSYAGGRLFSAIEPFLDCYSVVADATDDVITVAHRYKRLKSN